jgi:hypothetical protein
MKDIQNLIMRLLKNRAIYEATIEELNIWDGFEKILPSYITFPECLDFNMKGYCRRTREIKRLKNIIDSIDNNTKKLIKTKEFIMSYHAYQRAKISPEFEERKRKLNLHLIKLRELREKRKEVEKLAKDNGVEIK